MGLLGTIAGDMLGRVVTGKILPNIGRLGGIPPGRYPHPIYGPVVIPPTPSLEPGDPNIPPPPKVQITLAGFLGGVALAAWLYDRSKQKKELAYIPGPEPADPVEECLLNYGWNLGDIRKLKASIDAKAGTGEAFTGDENRILDHIEGCLDVLEKEYGSLDTAGLAPCPCPGTGNAEAESPAPAGDLSGIGYEPELFKVPRGQVVLHLQDPAKAEDLLLRCLERRGWKPKRVQEMQAKISEKLTPGLFTREPEKLTGGEIMLQEAIDECLKQMSKPARGRSAEQMRLLGDLCGVKMECVEFKKVPALSPRFKVKEVSRCARFQKTVGAPCITESPPKLEGISGNILTCAAWAKNEAGQWKCAEYMTTCEPGVAPREEKPPEEPAPTKEKESPIPGAIKFTEKYILTNKEPEGPQKKGYKEYIVFNAEETRGLPPLQYAYTKVWGLPIQVKEFPKYEFFIAPFGNIFRMIESSTGLAVSSAQLTIKEAQKDGLAELMKRPKKQIVSMIKAAHKVKDIPQDEMSVETQKELVLKALEPKIKDFFQLQNETGLTPDVLSSVLVQLELEGEISRLPGKRFMTKGKPEVSKLKMFYIWYPKGKRTGQVLNDTAAITASGKLAQQVLDAANKGEGKIYHVPARDREDALQRSLEARADQTKYGEKGSRMVAPYHVNIAKNMYMVHPETPTRASRTEPGTKVTAKEAPDAAFYEGKQKAIESYRAKHGKAPDAAWSTAAGMIDMLEKSGVSVVEFPAEFSELWDYSIGQIDKDVGIDEILRLMESDLKDYEYTARNVQNTHDVERMAEEGYKLQERLWSSTGADSEGIERDIRDVIESAMPGKIDRGSAQYQRIYRDRYRQARAEVTAGKRAEIQQKLSRWRDEVKPSIMKRIDGADTMSQKLAKKARQLSALKPSRTASKALDTAYKIRDWVSVARQNTNTEYEETFKKSMTLEGVKTGLLGYAVTPRERRRGMKLIYLVRQKRHRKPRATTKDLFHYWQNRPHEADVYVTYAYSADHARELIQKGEVKPYTGEGDIYKPEEAHIATEKGHIKPLHTMTHSELVDSPFFTSAELPPFMTWMIDKSKVDEHGYQREFRGKLPYRMRKNLYSWLLRHQDGVKSGRHEGQFAIELPEGKLSFYIPEDVYAQTRLWIDRFGIWKEAVGEAMREDKRIRSDVVKEYRNFAEQTRRMLEERPTSPEAPEMREKAEEMEANLRVYDEAQERWRQMREEARGRVREALRTPEPAKPRPILRMPKREEKITEPEQLRLFGRLVHAGGV